MTKETQSAAVAKKENTCEENAKKKNMEKSRASGGIGIHNRLKICRQQRAMRVRVPPRPPI